MQSVHESQILEKQISQLFVEVISIWRDTDIKKSQAVRMLAARLEEYYLQKGQPQEVQYICKKIVDKLKENGLEATAGHAYDYLEDKYKQQTFQHTRSDAGAVLDNNVLAFQNIDLKQVPVEIKQKAFDLLSKFTDNIEKDAQAEHYALFKQHDSDFDNFNTQYESRGIISAPKPPPKETELSDAIQKSIDALTELKKDVIEFPPETKVEARIFSKGWEAFTKIIRWITDDKYSLHPMEWLNKEMYRQFQGKHAAAVFEKAVTVLCEHCSKGLDDDPNEYEIMYADYRSPSGWKCIKCKGTQGILRGMTREQIGDRTVYIEQFAQDIIETLPMLLDSFKWFDARKKPYNSARKPILGPDLSKRA